MPFQRCHSKHSKSITITSTTSMPDNKFDSYYAAVAYLLPCYHVYREYKNVRLKNKLPISNIDSKLPKYLILPMHAHSNTGKNH